MNNRSVVAVVTSRERAERTVEDLQLSGVPATNVSVLLPDRSGTRDFAHEHNTKAPEAAVAGVGAGGVLGGTLGLLAGIGALAIPGVGPLIAAGPLMGALSGAAAGAAVGGVAGALVGMGIPEYEAKAFEGKIQSGNILIAVHVATSEQEDSVKKTFEQNGATDVSVTDEASVPKSKHPPLL